MARRKSSTTIQKLVPNARIAIGHGQMDEKTLEKVIIDFANHEYDVLLATTIIENGIDIPNANTMIIHNADKFGLAQLYQLRGRVGRSQRQAYCYCLYTKSKEIKRLPDCHARCGNPRCRQHLRHQTARTHGKCRF